MGAKSGNGGMIEIKAGVVIDTDDLVFRFSRSSGPGGQNVNKVSSRVTVLFNVVGSGNLSAAQKKRVSAKLATRVNKEGILRVVSQRHRTQRANKRAATERLVELLAEALARKKLRKKTKKPYSAVRKRLESKKMRGELKRQRSKKIDIDS